MTRSFSLTQRVQDVAHLPWDEGKPCSAISHYTANCATYIHVRTHTHTPHTRVHYVYVRNVHTGEAASTFAFVRNTCTRQITTPQVTQHHDTTTAHLRASVSNTILSMDIYTFIRSYRHIVCMYYTQQCRHVSMY